MILEVSSPIRKEILYPLSSLLDQMFLEIIRSRNNFFCKKLIAELLFLI